MSVSNDFKAFLEKIKVDNADVITLRYAEITRVLNKRFRNSESTEENSLQVGSYGRYTAIKGISDLDMIYIMPDSQRSYYQSKQSQLLSDTKDAILARYPRTDVKVDRLVVVVTYTNFKFEVQPVFEREDGGFDYPDTSDGGSWKVTRPRSEIRTINEVNNEKSGNLKLLCKMARAWKNKNGIVMGGLLIDTLAHNFMKSTSDYDDKSYFYYGVMCHDFFKFLSNLPEREWFAALGSKQRVLVKKKFQKRAKNTHQLCVSAIQNNNSNNIWRQVFGSAYPRADVILESTNKSKHVWSDTEEFIDEILPEDIRYELNVECEVSQKGFRKKTLSDMIRYGIPLKTKKSLLFKVISTDVPAPYIIKWKVLNQGEEAERRNLIRGQILDDKGFGNHEENTEFLGEHVVECYAIKNGVVVAKSIVNVPIR
ncbi:SMODS domain-containing nucleotidyltransferase [Aeromonas hydrophila]|uniref:SMODS domain-containing nucleotidyltransferase n=1 Tax=Aeromonas hydrophila TaxID=644 RepID=UPI0009BFFDF5|nr:nucleotidyltransferase [Aeromonas hydrophila]